MRYGDAKSALEAKRTRPAELRKETHSNSTFPFPLADTLVRGESRKFPLHSPHLMEENFITVREKEKKKRQLSSSKHFCCFVALGRVLESC